jgi:HEAT repeat protein
MTGRCDHLIEQLASLDPTARRYAAEDLGDLHDARAVPALVEAVSDPEVEVREAAVDTLVVIGGQAVCEHVAPLLETEDLALQSYAIEILERVGPQSIDVLVAACNSASPEVRKLALDILGKVARGCAGECLDTIVALLADDNPEVASSAAEALGQIGDARATPYLAKHLGDPPWMQLSVFSALSQIGGEAALEALGSVDIGQLSPLAKHFFDSALKVTEVSVRKPQATECQ